MGSLLAADSVGQWKKELDLRRGFEFWKGISTAVVIGTKLRKRFEASAARAMKNAL